MMFDRKELIDYVLKRQNSDGGFGFVPPFCGLEFPSGLPDTYHCVSILSMLGKTVENPDKTSEYLKKTRADYTNPSPTYSFYIFEASRLLGKKLRAGGEEIKTWEQVLKRGPATQLSEGYGAAGSPYQDVYSAIYLLKKYGNGTGTEEYEIKQNQDGGFGPGASDIASTAHCIAINGLLGLSFDREKAVRFILSCGANYGGFSIRPNAEPAFVETTYYASLSFSLLGAKIPESAALFAAMLQNADGGFRRSIFGGISSPEYSYLALSTIMHFEKMQSGGDWHVE